MKHDLTIDIVRAVANASRRARNLVSFRRFTHLTPQVAAELVQLPLSSLCLDGLTEMSDELAEALSVFRGSLELAGLRQTSLRAIEHLCRERPGLSLGMHQLTEAQAIALLKFPGTLTLPEWTFVDDTAAHIALLDRLSDDESFDSYRLVNLPLSALRVLIDKVENLELSMPSLSIEQAEVLAQHRGRLMLYGLNTLTPEAARILLEHQGALVLYGSHDGIFESLPLETIAELSRFQHELRLDVKTLSVEAARCFAESFHGSLELVAVSDVSPEAVGIIAKVNGGTCSTDEFRYRKPPGLGVEDWTDAEGHLQYVRALVENTSLDRIAEVSDMPTERVVQAWADKNFALQVLRTIEIWSIRSLTPTIARILSQHDGGVIIRRLEQLPIEVAQVFAAAIHGIYFRGVVGPITSEVAEFLADCDKIHGVINHLEHIPDCPSFERLLQRSLERRTRDAVDLQLFTDWLSPAAAEVIVTFPQKHSLLELPCMHRISCELGEVLQRWQGAIYLGHDQEGKVQLDVEQAKVLAEFQASHLSLALEQLQPEVAAELAKFPGTLWLGVEQLSDEAAEQLARHRNKLSLSRLKHLTIAAADHLAKHRRIQRPDAALEYYPELCASKLFR